MSHLTQDRPDYAICFLAGGQARRMGGGDKAEIDVGGKTLLASLLERFDSAPYRFINANGDSTRFAHYGLEVVPDLLPDYQGPLSGIYAGLCHLKSQQKRYPEIQFMMVVPTDAPLIAQSHITDMLHVARHEHHKLVSVSSHGRTHPVIGLWSLSVCESLGDALMTQNIRKIDAFTAQIGCHYLSYDNTPDPFLNLNRPADLEHYHALMTASSDR